MNMKFSRQTNRKPIASLDVHEKRFEPKELFPSSLSQNKRMIIDIKMDKQIERGLPWIGRKGPALEYDTVDVDKYKFKKSTKPYII